MKPANDLTTTTNNKIYFPNLDGLRFISFLSVFFYHSFATNYQHIKTDSFYTFVKFFLVENGILGVNFFFVLSGFLITYLLLAEKNNYGSININSFYMRRILRIWPLFYLCIVFGFFIFPKLKLMMGQVPNETAEIEYYLVFLNNLNFIKNGLPDASTLGVLWSVAVEEQFYLFWPLLIYFIPAKYYLQTFLGIVIGSFCFRCIYAPDPWMLENHTFSCISDMTVGGIFAYLSFTFPSFVRNIKQAPKVAWIALYMGVITVYLFRQQIFATELPMALDRLVIAVIFGLVIMEQNYADNSFYKMSRFKLISRLGTYTYGLYCLHMVGILIAAILLRKTNLNTNVYQVIFLEGGLSLVISIGLAIASYHLYEAPFLKLKERFSPAAKKAMLKENSKADNVNEVASGKTTQSA